IRASSTSCGRSSWKAGSASTLREESMANRSARREVGQAMGSHDGRRTVEPFDLDQAGLGDAALAELGRPDVKGQRIRIAMLLQRLVGAGLGRIEPRAGGEPNHAATDAIAQPRGGKTGAAIVEHAQEVAVGDAAGGRIVRMDGDRLAAPDLGGA